MRIAVAGNPNCGKSTLFNALCGTRAHVGNYPGVTVERKSAPLVLPSGRHGELIDLPGCTSLVARSFEEDVAHGVLLGGDREVPVDVVLSVVDATQLGRGLYLVLQLKELGLPQVVALNMMDAAQAQGMRIHVAALARALDARVAPMVAQRGEGIELLLGCLDSCTAEHDATNTAPLLAHLHLGETHLRALQDLPARLGVPRLSLGSVLWLVCSDTHSLSEMSRDRLARILDDPAARAAVDATRRTLDAQAGPEGFARHVIRQRYAAVDAIVRQTCLASGTLRDAATARLDRVLLHPWVGPLLFACTMFGLFQAVFLGAEPMMGAVEEAVATVGAAAQALLPNSHVASLLCDGVLPGIGSVLAFVPQIGLLFCGLSLLEESGYMARAAFLLDTLMRHVGLHGKAFIPLLSSFGCAIPGIMAARTIEAPRDRLVTILIAPFMSCSARLPVYTLVVAATMAHMPKLFGVFSVGGIAIFAMYSLGFIAAVLTAFVLKRTALRAPAPPLLLDLPRLQAPRLPSVLRIAFERCAVFVKQTGQVILALSVLLWGALNFPRQGLDPALRGQKEAEIARLQEPLRSEALAQLEHLEQASILDHSLAGRLGHAIEPVIAPLGFDWRIGIALVASFAAREVLVSTLGQIYALDADTPPSSPALRQALRSDLDPSTGQPRFTWLVGVSLMVFFVLALQCLSTVAVVKRETGGWRWPLLQLGGMNALAYAASLAVYQGGRALGFG